MNDDCRKTRDNVSEWIGGALPKAEERALQEHLDVCPHCREYAQSLKQEDASLANHFAHIGTDTAVRQDRVLQVLAYRQARSQTGIASLWRGIMTKRLPRVSIAAAAVLIGAVVCMQCFDVIFPGTAPVYGMTDLPSLLEEIRTLHVQSTQWIYSSDPNQPELETATVIPHELWLDASNLRTRFTSHMSWSTPDGRRGLHHVEGVHTASLAMDIDHTERTVRFNKVSAVWRRLAMRDRIQRYLHRIGENELEHFVKIGQETINGILHNIWEREGVDIHKANTHKRIRCWMAPSTGALGRVYIWEKANDGKWRLGLRMDTIEYNVEIPDSLFAFEAPADYKYQNTLETAYEGGLGRGFYFMGGALVSAEISFTLDDGSAIVGWHSGDTQKDRYADQEHLFRNLVPGGDLPALPMVIHGLKSIRRESYSPTEVVYTGRHLAHTKKDRWHYEWALFVPPRPLPSTRPSSSYRMLCRFNLGKEQAPQPGNPISENRIEADDFNDFVRAAMVELSDDGVAPAHVTYENVMALTRDIRSSVRP